MSEFLRGCEFGVAVADCKAWNTITKADFYWLDDKGISYFQASTRGLLIFKSIIAENFMLVESVTSTFRPKPSAKTIQL